MVLEKNIVTTKVEFSFVFTISENEVSVNTQLSQGRSVHVDPEEPRGDTAEQSTRPPAAGGAGQRHPVRPLETITPSLLNCRGQFR